VLNAERLAAILTVGELDAMTKTLSACQEAADAGATVTLFFRDETIPLICKAEVAAGITDEAGIAVGREVASLLRRLVAAGDVHCTACSSSLYLWGVSPTDLVPEVEGSRGLIAFLADDLAAATRVLSS